LKISIGLPTAIPGVTGETLLEWAKRADAGPFTSLGVIDRIAYGNYESMVTLAAVAGATSRVRLMTTILITTVRNATVLAKEAASLDSLSGGRLSLGLAVGGRQDDFAAVLASFGDRHVRFEDQIAIMKKVWSGQPLSNEVGPIGPAPTQPKGPELLLGGVHGSSLRRAAQLGDGYITLPARADVLDDRFRTVENEWRAAGRQSKPRLVGTIYYTLEPNGVEQANAYILDYYSFMGEMGHFMATSLLTTPRDVRAAIRSFADVGMDELVLWPGTARLDELRRLADAVAG
jgi:alkanesulfonate monooxygenase SsuD/methylene tetrahydromethanopterin reductase-like flavin-dependent oxidoreductase (luciferase family)